ncbi:basic proline-rich protein-like [Hylobates moloch]|uniref:basic proline-rich protein-like n=1 Tax=Hylobates moloch TaxID=81572 RepID=UPI0026764F50|nr:basic proline-rich protein-like [Hylobates moloch]
MAALALDQGEGKHQPGHGLAPSGRQQGPRGGASRASSPPPTASHPPPSLPAWRASASRRRRTGPPAGQPRLPGRAPGGSRGPQGARGPERPPARGPARPAPSPPLSRLPPPPAWVIPRLGALRGRSPETPSSTLPQLVLLSLPAAPQPFPPPAAPVGPPAEPRRVLRGPRRWQGRSGPRRRAASCGARLSGFATQRCLLSQDLSRGGCRRARSCPAGATRLVPGAAARRRPRSLPSAVPAPDRPPIGPLARFFLMQTAVH